MFAIYWIYYILGIVLLPGILLGILAQSKVVSTFNKYNKISTRRGKTAHEMARNMLDGGGCSETEIKKINGELTDNFNPTTNTVSLSQAVFNSDSIAAIGVTAHEVGHVFQYKEKYLPMKFRNILIPVLNFSSFLVWPLILLGLILETVYVASGVEILIYIGTGLYALNVVLCLITLPIEKNASKRAENMLLSTNELDEEEIVGVKKVLNAACWTYVAGLVTSLLSLLRLVIFIFTMRENRR